MGYFWALPSKEMHFKEEACGQQLGSSKPLPGLLAPSPFREPQQQCSCGLERGLSTCSAPTETSLAEASVCDIQPGRYFHRAVPVALAFDVPQPGLEAEDSAAGRAPVFSTLIPPPCCDRHPHVTRQWSPPLQREAQVQFSQTSCTGSAAFPRCLV